MNNPTSNEGDFASRLRRLGFALAGILFLAAWILGYAGYDQCYREAGTRLPWWDLAYLSFQLFGLEFSAPIGKVPTLLVIGRSLALLFTASAAMVALAGICRSEIRALRLGRLRGHAVVCGAGKKAEALIRDLLRARTPVVVIDLKATQALPDVPGGADLFAISGDAACADTLRLARAERAERVFITTGNDSANIEIAACLIRHCKSSSVLTGRVACHVHLADRQTEEIFKRHPIFKDAAERVDVSTFNVYDNAARLLWRERLLACGPTSPDDHRRLHVVIGGLGQMGEAVLLRLVRSAHYANGLKPAVTVFDLKAESCKERLLARYPALPRLCDLAFEEADLGHPKTASRIAAVLAEPGQLACAVLCLDDDYANFATALRLAPHLKAAQAAPIFIRLSRATGLYELLQSEHAESALARQIDGFGLTGVCCTRELVLTDQLSRMARALHEAYIFDRQRNANDAASKSNDSLRPWETLDETYRESNREQAEHLELKLRTFGFSAADSNPRLPSTFTDVQIELLGHMEHSRWCAERELAGWTYAPGPKNAENRTSPDLVPWDKLPLNVRKIDFDFVKAIPRTLATCKTT